MTGIVTKKLFSSLVLPATAVASVGVLCATIAILYHGHCDYDCELTFRTEEELRSLALEVQLQARLVKSLPPADIRALTVDFFDSTETDILEHFFDQGWLIRETNLLVDRWRNPLRLVAESTRQYKFISSGANGKDEEGQGDDIVYYFDPLEIWEQMDPEDFGQRDQYRGCGR